MVMLAHTIEDQMETICMRILADSGPEGLSECAITPLLEACHTPPLLKTSKGRLIATCKALNQIGSSIPVIKT